MKRIFALALLLSIVASCSLAVASELQPRASELIVDRYIYAYDYGGGKVKFTTDMTTLGAVDKLGFPSLKLQEKQGSEWVTVKSATDKYAYNTSVYSYSLSYNGTRGNQYRFVVEYYAKDGNISDTKSTTSSKPLRPHNERDL